MYHCRPECENGKDGRRINTLNNAEMSTVKGTSKINKHTPSFVCDSVCFIFAV